MAKRKKSAKQLYEQVDRLTDIAANRGWNGREYSASSIRRLEKIIEINERYQENIRKSFGVNAPYIDNNQYRTPVSRRVYMGLSNG